MGHLLVILKDKTVIIRVKNGRKKTKGENVHRMMILCVCSHLHYYHYKTGNSFVLIESYESYECVQSP